jgi:ATP-dependent RNA helicase SUPV3L1/SUV3
LVATLYGFRAREGRIPADWFAAQVRQSDYTEGGIDTLATRIAHVRTWAFVANRPDWLADPEEWQGVTREVEDRLSDALHTQLTQRFVDRRTSVLMRRLREKDMLEAEITATGEVLVEGHHVGALSGFRFTADATADGQEGKALRAAAQIALAREIEARADKLAAAPDADLVLGGDGTLRWLGAPVGRLITGERPLAPQVRLLADDSLSGPAHERAERRLSLWVTSHVKRLLGPLLELEAATDLSGVARGIAYRLVEALGVMDRAAAANEVRALGQAERAALRKFGVRFGAHHVYLPALLKPAPRQLATQLWALHAGIVPNEASEEAIAMAAGGRTSIPVRPGVSAGLARMLGYRLCGPRALRVDILERLVDLIRPALAYRPGITPGEAPPGAVAGGFTVTVAMTSLAGCSGEDFSAVLQALGYRSERVPAPPPAPVAPESEAVVAADAAETMAESAPAADASGPGEATEELAEDDAAEALVEEATETAEPEAEREVPATTAYMAAVEAAGQAAEADAAAEPSGEAAAESGAPAAPAMIEVWRPARHERRGPRPARGGPRRSKPVPADAASAAPETTKTGRPARRPPPQRADGPRNGGPGPRRPERPGRPERPPDPNSPFAALAELKARLEADAKSRH